MTVLNKSLYKNILVLGLAKSGTVAANILLKNGFNVRINDLNTKPDAENVVNLTALGAEVILGSHPLSVLKDIDLIVKNPGIPYEQTLIEEAVKKKIPIVTEVELARNLTSNPLIGITGSNGKTTTTTLVYEMLKASGVPAAAAGNIGHVATEVAETITKETLVVELSSFQLLGTLDFRPDIAVLLNIFPAHLDYHQTMSAYIDAKLKLIQNQTEADVLVYNYDDQILRERVQSSKAQLVPFSRKEQLSNGLIVTNGVIYFNTEKIINCSEIVLVGEHNLENVLAAIGAAKIAGATNKGIHEVLTSFQGVKHRLQFVLNKKERLFYNDSKATNILATEKALNSFSVPTILLCGGLDRGNDFDELIPAFKHVKALITFGETSNKLQETGRKSNIAKSMHVDNMEAAVFAAYEISKAGDVILLSPACASWDQYPTFEKRGELFIEAINTLV